MPQPAHIDPRPFRLGTGPTGALLIHGFTGSPAEMRGLGETLANHGLTALGPRLPGHGTRPEDLIGVSWRDWAAEVDRAYRDLQLACDRVFVIGLSLGSMLALWLGVHNPGIAGLIVMAPPVYLQQPLLPLTPVLKWFIRFREQGPETHSDLGDEEARNRVWCYDRVPIAGAAEVFWLQRQVRRRLRGISQPILVIQGRRDAEVPARSAKKVYARVQSADRTLCWFDNSGHNLLVDVEREAVWNTCTQWIAARSTPKETEARDAWAPPARARDGSRPPDGPTSIGD
jgi:carboxylesterase